MTTDQTAIKPPPCLNCDCPWDSCLIHSEFCCDACAHFEAASPNEMRSQLYAWLGDRTSQPDGDVWTHEQLMPAARDLAAFINRTLQGDNCD